jgi:hypothetical protein
VAEYDIKENGFLVLMVKAPTGANVPAAAAAPSPAKAAPAPAAVSPPVKAPQSAPSPIKVRTNKRNKKRSF